MSQPSGGPGQRVGIVVVSHSEPLAHAAVELAMQMAGDDPPVVEVAAGSDGGLGTDATAVAAAIQRVDEANHGAGVLVVTDLGSALLSAEMALEFVDPTGEVQLSRSAFVEGLVAAVVQASMGKPLADVEREAARALGAKAAQLGDGAPPPAAPAAAASEPRPDPAPVAEGMHVHRDAVVVNPQGIHARPAALLARTAAELGLDVSITNLDTGAGPAEADSTLELMTIGARQGTSVRLSADGPGAAAALATLAELIESGLGEGTGDPA